eukprot:3986605-Alexandrium_andersonii.AAC.1
MMLGGRQRPKRRPEVLCCWCTAMCGVAWSSTSTVIRGDLRNCVLSHCPSVHGDWWRTKC